MGRIFIDINYTAVPVTNARKCLMDDKDLASLFVQALVNDDDIHNERQGKYLIPQLVDWHSENLKHQLPHITGVLVLYQIMSDVILNRSNLISIDDLRKKSKVKRWVSRLRGRFLVDEKIKDLVEYNEIETLHSSLKRYEKEIAKDKDDDDDNLEALLFNYDYYVLEVAQKVFIQVYCKSIVRFFTELYYYKQAISILEKKNAFDKNYTLSKILVTSPKKFNENQKNIYKETEQELKEQLEPKFYLLLTVLGQKTLFEIFFKRIDSFIGSEVTEEKVEEAASEFINTYNKIFKILNNYSNDYSIFGLKGHSEAIPPKFQKDYSIVNYGVQASSFWEDIIYKGSFIIYNNQGIQALRCVFNYIESFFKMNNFSFSENISYPSESEFHEMKYAPSRISNRLEKEQNVKVGINEAVTKNILNAKRDFLNEYLSNALKEWSEKQIEGSLD